MKKAILYINQFFGQIGGEDKADFEPELRVGHVGPAPEFAKQLDAEITHTIICGDNYMGSNTEQATAAILGMMEDIKPDIFLAGPAFQAGRYGVACGTICKAVSQRFGIPVLTSMHEENPGVDMFKAEMPIMKGGNSAAKMRTDVKAMCALANKMISGTPTLGAQAEGYFERGLRRQVWTEGEVPASERMIDMLLKKLNDRPYQTEMVINLPERVAIAPPLSDLKGANVAIINTGGIVPIDNPDKIQSASATRWGRYDMQGMEKLQAGEYKTIHAGFDPAAADADPNVIVPLDVLRDLEKEGVYGKLHRYFYSTVGTGTTQAEAQRMAQEIIPFLLEDHVKAVLLVST